MDDYRLILHSKANIYLGCDPVKVLGYGNDGIVYQTHRASALKICQQINKYHRELAAYERLRECKVTEICGFSVPILVGSSEKLMAIEMSVVQPPCIVDFAQAYLDFPFEYEEGSEEHWWNQIREDFGNNFAKAEEVFYFMQNKFDLYYYDLAPRNLMFKK